MKINTPEDVYNNIYFFTYGNCNIDKPKEEIIQLRNFINQLFNISNKTVKPFNEKETARIRSIYGVGPTIFEEDNIDLIDLLRRLYDYMLYGENKSYKFKTRA